MKSATGLWLNRRRVEAALFATALVLALTPGAAGAEGPYEPNDAISTAVGPLLDGQVTHATLESEGDKDFFYFYVGAPERTYATLTIEDQGGGSKPLPEIDAQIVDSHGNYMGGDFGLRPGESRTSSVALEPGKYFIELDIRAGYGDSYNLVPHSEDGAFADYETIAGHCATATTKVDALRKDTARLKVKLERALSRLRRSRFDGAQQRRAARSLYAEARRRVRTRQRATKVAIRGQSPWCSIPQ